MDKSDRTHLNFEEKVRTNFTFLEELGFSEVESMPTFMLYRKNGIQVDIYHGQQSFEVGAGVTAFGTRYEISEILNVSNTEIAKNFRHYATTTSEGLNAGLEQLGSLMSRYCRNALDGDPQFFSTIKKQRKLWSEEYAIDVLSKQLRPQATEAFRHGDYSKAADLYSTIKERLSPAEIEKLNFATRKAKATGHSSEKEKP